MGGYLAPRASRPLITAMRDTVAAYCPGTGATALERVFGSIGCAICRAGPWRRGSVGRAQLLTGMDNPPLQKEAPEPLPLICAHPGAGSSVEGGVARSGRPRSLRLTVSHTFENATGYFGPDCLAVIVHLGTEMPSVFVQQSLHDD